MTEADTSAPPRSRSYGPVVVGAMLVLVGALWLLDALEVIDVRASVVLPGVLAVVGISLMVGALDGPHSGLVVFGVFLTLAVVLAAVFPGVQGGLGERTYVVEDQSELEATYGVGLGEVSLDLSGLVLTESAEVDVTVGAGEISVVLPADGEVRVDASAGAGEVSLLGESADGVSVTRTYTSSGYEEADTALTLDIDVAAGEIQVTR